MRISAIEVYPFSGAGGLYKREVYPNYTFVCLLTRHHANIFFGKHDEFSYPLRETLYVLDRRGLLAVDRDEEGHSRPA